MDGRHARRRNLVNSSRDADEPAALSAGTLTATSHTGSAGDDFIGQARKTPIAQNLESFSQMP
jgi:hypothetical protein